MNIRFGFNLLSAAAVLALAGCMSANTDEGAETRAANANALKFVNASARSLAKTVAAPPAGQQPDLADVLRSAGVCEKFVQLVVDLKDCDKGGCEESLPRSTLDFLDCFGLNIEGQGSIDDIDTLVATLQNFQKFESCVCGGSGGLGGFDALKYKAFSAEVSAAAGAAFNASNSAAAGAAFNASNSTAAGAGFNGSNSNVAGKGFSAE